MPLMKNGRRNFPGFDKRPEPEGHAGTLCLIFFPVIIVEKFDEEAQNN